MEATGSQADHLSLSRRRGTQNLEPSRRTSLDEFPEKVKLVADVARDKGVAAMGPVDSGPPGKDLPILLASVRSGATHLLTGDFKHFGPHYGKTIEGVLIMPPADYLRLHRPEDV